MAIVAQVTLATTKATEATASRLTSLLRDFAYRAEWPVDVIIQLSVKVEESNLVVSYPDEIHDEVNDLEYGTSGTSPRAVLRPFVSRLGSFLEQEVSEGVIDTLAFMGVFN